MIKHLALTIAVLFFTTQIIAASPTPSATISATPTKDAKLTQIDDLKERLATKVAELRTSQKKAIAGTIKSVTVSTVTVETTTSDVKLELTDDIGVFQIIKGKRTKLTTDNLEKGDNVVVYGDYDSSLDLLKAKVFFIQSTLSTRTNGTITGIDKVEYTVTIKSSDEKIYIIDIEKNTLINGFSAESGIVKSGFSKIVVGDTIHVAGIPSAKEDNRMSAVRILDIGSLSATGTPTPTAESTPTASASATAKTTPKTTVKQTTSPTPAP